MSLVEADEPIYPGNGNGRIKTASTTANMAMVAAMPTPSVRKVVNAKTRSFQRERTAYRRSAKA
jgi:hypothetical protein